LGSFPPVTIYTDGGCIGNPGPGGYGVVIITPGVRKEISAGFNLTTNNRMELAAAIAGLKAIGSRSKVTLLSDSRYLVDGMTLGWAAHWRSRGWRKAGRGKALNTDLWQQLLDLCERHEVIFEWIRGHSGSAENERCDQLSMQAARKRSLPPDPGYNPGLGAAPSLF
jgi:ribonuclease HI